MFSITIYFYFVVHFSRNPVAHLSLISYLPAVLVYRVHVPTHIIPAFHPCLALTPTLCSRRDALLTAAMTNHCGRGTST